MREIIVTEFISLDGVVEAPGGEEDYRHTGWTFDIETDATMYDYKFQETLRGGGAGARPGAPTTASRTPGRSARATSPTLFNTMPKYVVSTTLTDPAWNNTHVLGSIEEVARLRAGGGRAAAGRRAAPPWPRPCTTPGWSTSGG